jgi:hypothetical protein
MKRICGFTRSHWMPSLVMCPRHIALAAAMVIVVVVSKIELFTDSVFLVGIGWYFLGILPTNTEGKLGWYILVLKKWWEPLFPSKKGDFGPLLEHSAPLLRDKGFPVKFFKKNVPRNFKKEFSLNPTVQKIPTGYTNLLVPVPYRYWSNGQYWDGNNTIKITTHN